jgi:DNA-binding PadR family transcriptional regulator
MHGWGPPPPFGRRGGRERLFEKGELKYLFLDLLREKPRHGYDLIRAIEERSGGRYQASPGAVYPILQMLEDLGYVAASTQDGRKTYAVTDAGQAFLDENAEAVEEVRRRVKAAWGGGDREDWHAIAQEMGEFAHLFGRGRPKRRIPPDAMRRILDVIRRARGEIEAILDEAED